MNITTPSETIYAIDNNIKLKWYAVRYTCDVTKQSD